MTDSKKLFQHKTCEIIDLSELNIFDAVKNIVLISTNNLKTNPNEKIKFKVASKNIQNLLNDLPLSNIIEII